MSISLERFAMRLGAAGVLREVRSTESWQAIGVTAVSADSRAITRGTLFCAVKGTHHDSHSNLPAAAGAGAVAAVVEHANPDLPIPQLVVVDGRLGAAHAENIFMKIILKPGLVLQRVTTRNPDDGMLEVAIAAFKRVAVRDGVMPEEELNDGVIQVDQLGQPLVQTAPAVATPAGDD